MDKQSRRDSTGDLTGKLVHEALGIFTREECGILRGGLHLHSYVTALVVVGAVLHFIKKLDRHGIGEAEAYLLLTHIAIGNTVVKGGVNRPLDPSDLSTVGGDDGHGIIPLAVAHKSVGQVILIHLNSGHTIAPAVISVVGICGMRILWVLTFFNLDLFHSMIGLYIVYPLSWGLTSIMLAVLTLFILRKLPREDVAEPAVAVAAEL